MRFTLLVVAILCAAAVCAVTPTNPGDLNNDNAVNINDVLLVANCLGQSAATCSSGRADPNNDGQVNIFDFVHVSQQWGRTYTITNPSTVNTVAVTGTTANSITISFTEVNDGTGQPAKYALRYDTPTISWGSAPDVMTGNCGQPALGSSIGATKSCTISGLSANTQYQVQLVSFRGTLNQADAVFGGLSNIVTATTTAGGAPTVTISANPTSITSGQSSTLSWSSTSATSCTASGGWSGNKATGGSQSVSPTSTTTYTLSCTGTGGTTQQSTTVTVSAAAVCGNGVQEGSEQCDTGASRGACPATCSTSCTANSCGSPSNPYANRPSNYNTVLTNYSFNDVVPVAEGASMGSDGWGVNNGANLMARVSDTSAPVSQPNVLQWTYAAGQGTPTSSAGFGMVFRDYPASTQEFYIAFSVWHDPNFEWNSVSNKLFYIEPGNIILESKEFSNYLSVYIGAYGEMYRNPAASIPLGQWVNIEMQVKRGANGFVRVWMNGQQVQNLNVPVPDAGGYGEIKLDSTWGGGAGPTQRTSYRRVDHIFVAVPSPDSTAPTASISAPIANQVLAAGTTSTTLSVTTNEAATCRWSTSNQAYSSMPNTFTTTGSTSHTTSLTGLSNGNAYTRYVRCQDTAGNAMTASQSVTFSVASPGGVQPAWSDDFRAYTTTAQLLASSKYSGSRNPGDISLVTGQTSYDGTVRPFARFTMPGTGSGQNWNAIQYGSGGSSSNVWIEMWVRMSPNFPGTYTGFQEVKFMLAFWSAGSRFNLEAFNGGDRYVLGYPGDGNTEAAKVASMPAVMFDGQWHRYQFHFTCGSGGVAAWGIDGQLIDSISAPCTSGSVSEFQWGPATINNQGTATIWMDHGYRAVYNQNPGWGW